MDNAILSYRVISKFLAIIMAIVVILTYSSFQLSLNTIFYLLGILYFIFFLTVDINSIRLSNRLMLSLVLICFFSILFNDIPSYYQSEQRFAMFVCFTTLLGPLIISRNMALFRKQLFYYLNILIIVYCTLSYVLSVTGIYDGYKILESGRVRPDFSGLFNHSMVLCPFSGISILTCLYFYYSTKFNKTVKTILLICISLCFLSAVVAGSRSALMSTFAGILFFFYKLYRKNIGKYMKIVFSLLTIIVLSFPLWQEGASRLVNKITASVSEEDDYDWTSSRESLWEQRLQEFKSSPLIGIGFAAENPKFSKSWDEEYIETSGGKIEPGSSWLAVLSMTGILGFILIVILFLKNFIFILKAQNNRLWISYLGGILVIFTLHMFAEGYIYAFGAMMFFYLWLFLGVVELTKFEYKANLKS